jgi:DNA-binding transcriptional MerR regulator
MSPTTLSDPPRPDETYSLDQLSEMADVPVRTIRYYIQRGLVSRPEGEKKGAYYTRSHLEQLLQIRKWVGAGMSLDRAAALLHGEASATPPPASTGPQPLNRREVSVYSLAEGLELVIDPLRCALSPTDITRLLHLLQTNLAAGQSALPAFEE